MLNNKHLLLNDDVVIICFIIVLFTMLYRNLVTCIEFDLDDLNTSLYKMSLQDGTVHISISNNL